MSLLYKENKIVLNEIESMEARYRNRARLAKQRLDESDHKRQQAQITREAKMTKKLMIKLRAADRCPMAHIAAQLTDD
jgi:hypothetical protein